MEKCIAGLVEVYAYQLVNDKSELKEWKIDGICAVVPECCEKSKVEAVTG